MLCPHCRNAVPENTKNCPVCGQVIGEQDQGRVLDAELVGQDGASGQGKDQQGGRNIVFRVFSSSSSANADGGSISGGGTFGAKAFGNGVSAGCLPGIITLCLTVMLASSYGILAAIGFLVFAAIGKGISFTLTLKSLLNNRPVNPWVFHIITWAVCWWLVTWLSGN